MRSVGMAVALALFGAATMASQTERVLTLKTARFYAPQAGSTTIEGVCEISLPELFSGMSQAVRYRFEVRLTDSTGLELLNTGWDRDVPSGMGQAHGATALESFSFAAAPGRYHIRISAQPAGGSHGASEEADVVAFGQRPSISDVVLAAAVRRPASDSEALAPGEIRRAGLVMQTAPLPKLSPANATLSYYAEVYPWRGAAGAGEIRAAVVAADGRTIIQTPARSLTVDSAGGLTRGTLDLTGLPEGTYRLRLLVRLADSTITAEAPFAVAPLSTLADARPTAAPVTDMFADAEEARLDSLYAPLVFLMDRTEQRSVYSSLSVEGKRRFLREFWRRRDPTPRDAENTAMAEFYRGVTYANEAFREGGVGQIPGWRTDRGRIYLKNGRPDEVLRRPSASPRPYEVWRLTRDRSRYYVFYDQSGFGHYVLIGTNDRSETGYPDWTRPDRYLSRENLDDVNRFLGFSASDQPE